MTIKKAAPVYEETVPHAPEPEVLQEEIELARVPVDIAGDVRVYQLPFRRTQTGTDVVTDVSAVEILPASTKRSRALLVAIDGPILISAGKSSFSVWPMNQVYEAQNADSINVKALTVSSSTRVGWTAEYWAD